MPKGVRNGGRQKGTKNKVNQTLNERAAALGVDPFEILLKFAAEDWKGLGYDDRTTTSYTNAGIEFEEFIIKPELRGHCAKEACKYLHAQRKHVEATIDPVLAEQIAKYDAMPTEELRAILKNLIDGSKATD